MSPDWKYRRTFGLKIKKPQKKEKIKKEKPEKKDRFVKAETPKQQAGGFVVDFGDGDFDFAASIRAAEPILKLKGSEKAPGLKEDLLQNVAGTVLIAAVLSMFCMAQENPGLIPFMMTGAALFFALTLAEALKPGKFRWIFLGVTAALLIASVVFMRGSILGGLGSMMNSFYDYAEEAQAYIYSRFPVDESGSDRFAAIWVSCLLGLVMALPAARVRRAFITLLAMATMFAVAYYGMIPSWICIAVMLAALILLISRGSILSTLPLLLAALVVFGSLMLIDPGESYGISRMDENFRDRFAFHSTLIETPEQEIDEPEEIDSIDEDEDERENNESVFSGEYGTYAALGIAALASALIAAAIYLLRRRLKKKQAVVRAGINSSDPKTAVTAMFPYSVRWLKAGGIESEKKKEEPFSAMVPAVSKAFSADYGNRFDSMYSLWKEAAYSDHAVSDENLQDMKGFMNETIRLIKNKSTFKEKMKIKFRHAL